MAEVGDFQDLLDAIKTAKSILEPNRLDEIKETYKLERQNLLDVENLKSTRSEIEQLRRERETAFDKLTELDKEQFKNVLSPSTGAVSQLYQGRISTLDDTLARLEQQKNVLHGQIQGAQKITAVKQSSARDFVKYQAAFQSKGWSPLLFEQADFDLAVGQYQKDLKLIKKPNGDPLSDNELAMREHYFKESYNSVYLSNWTAYIKESFEEKEGDLTETYKDWKVWASPTGAKVAGGVIQQGLGVPQSIETAYGRYVSRIEQDMQRMYDDGVWTPQNAPIIIDNGEAKLDEKKLIDLKPAILQVWERGVRDFLSHNNTTEAFRSAYTAQTDARFLLQEHSEELLAPGFSFGRLLWEGSFASMEDFYKTPEVRRYLNLQQVAPMTQTSYINNYLYNKKKGL